MEPRRRKSQAIRPKVALTPASPALSAITSSFSANIGKIVRSGRSALLARARHLCGQNHTALDQMIQIAVGGGKGESDYSAKYRDKMLPGIHAARRLYGVDMQEADTAATSADCQS